MKKILLCIVALVCAVSMWADDPIIEGPWTLIDFKPTSCAKNQNDSMCYNDANAEPWPGWYACTTDQYGTGFHYQGNSPDYTKMGFFAIFKSEMAMPSYSSMTLTWKYTFYSQSKKHYSTVCLHTLPDEYDSISSLKVPFTNRYDQLQPAVVPPMLGWFYNDSYSGNMKGSGQKTAAFTFDNINGNTTQTKSWYLLMSYMIGSDDQMINTSLDERGTFKSDDIDTVWTYRKIVIFDANGGTGTMENQNIDNSGKLSPKAFTRDGYIFQGWATEPNGPVVYVDQDFITATAEDKGPQTLYAVWVKWGEGAEEGPWTQLEWNYAVRSTEDQDHNIKFTEMNGEQWPGTISAIHDNIYGIGFRYEGSSPDNSLLGIFSTYMTSITVPSYARAELKWRYFPNSMSTKHHSATCLYGPADSYEELTNMDVDFTNHYTDKSGEDSLLTPPLLNEYQDGQTLMNICYYTFDCDNRDGSEELTQTRYMMMTYVIGSGAGKSGLYEHGAFDSDNVETTWTYRKIVTFDANGGFGTMENQNIDNSGKLSPNAFTRAGYVFTGWATEQNGPVVYVDKESITVTEESKGPMTLYAKWKSIQSVDIPDPFIGWHLHAKGIILEIESPHDSIVINLYILDVEGHDNLVSGKTYTWEDMGHDDCFVELKGIPVDRIPLVDANITRMYDDQGKYHMFGYAVDALGNRYSFHKDYYPETKGDTIEVAVTKSMNLEYDGQWHLSGDNRVYQMMLTFNSGMDSLVGHYTKDNIDTTLSYVYKMRNSMLSIRQADIDITETGDTLTISAYLAASDSNVYHFNGFYTAPKPLIKDTIIATNLYIDTDNLYGISGIFQAEASNQNYVVKLSLSTESDDIYGTHTIGLTTGNSGVIIDNSTARATYLYIYAAELTVLPTEFGTVIIGSALCNGNIEYDFHLSYNVPAKTRDANLDMQHLSLEQGVGTWTLFGFSDDSTQFVSLDFNNYEIAGLYDIVHMSPNESYIMTDIKWQNGKAVSYNHYQLIDADLAAAWDDEEGVASVIGTIRAKDREDIPEFIVNLSNSPSKPQGLEESISISDGHWHKVLHDGVLFIEKDGKIFNVLGQPVR